MYARLLFNLHLNWLLMARGVARDGSRSRERRAARGRVAARAHSGNHSNAGTEREREREGEDEGERERRERKERFNEPPGVSVAVPGSLARPRAADNSLRNEEAPPRVPPAEGPD